MTTTEHQDDVTIYSERIIADPQVCGGKPIVKGTRIPVEIVLEQLALSPDLSALFADYPRLTIEDVKACLEFVRSGTSHQPLTNREEETKLAENLSTGITIRFDSETLQILRERAQEKGLGPTTLARMWILERLRQEKRQENDPKDQRADPRP